MDEIRDHVGFVYFVRCPYSGNIKIGYSFDDPDGRFNIIQACSPHILGKHALMLGSRELEAELHARMRKHQDHNEWFRPAKYLEDFIEKYASEWTPETVALLMPAAFGTVKPPKPAGFVVKPIPCLSDDEKARSVVGGSSRPRGRRYGPLQALLDKLKADESSRP